MTNIRTLCAFPGCKSIATKNSRCSIHQQHSKGSRSSTTKNNDVYNGTKWRNLRKRKAQSSPLCEHCLKHNIIRPLDVVDHILPILDYPELTYAYDNLQSLCHSCHNEKTAKETANRTKPKDVKASDLFKRLKS